MVLPKCRRRTRMERIEDIFYVFVCCGGGGGGGGGWGGFC